MKQPQTHHLVDFASRYARSSFNTFNPASAKWRVEILIEDIDSLIKMAEEAEKHSIAFGSIYSTYEIVSYFSVGLVTCLEWHARSRMVDLMQYRPSAIRTTDLKGIADVALSQMVANGVNVPHLFGAATKVSSIKDYVAIFDRLFDDLDIKVSAERTVRAPRVSDIYGQETSLYELLEGLFEFRHHLVHEISSSVVGAFQIRGAWSLAEAKEYATNVLSCIQTIEALITQHTPSDFPNRLDKDGYVESTFDKLTEAIAQAERDITDALTKNDDALQEWNLALTAQKAALQKEFDFLEASETLQPVRYFDTRHSMKEELLKTRLTFLLALKVETSH